MRFDEIEARWEKLDPVFIRGMQRSGTSIMARALQRMKILGFGEGHLWFELVEPFARLRDPDYCPDLRVDIYTLGQGRVSKLEKYIAVALDQFHRACLPSHLERWMDKSPGADAVRVAPLLADLFPKAQFIFMYRSGITNVLSGVKFWKANPDIFHIMCEGWAETMSSWRQMRNSLGDRYIEIAQEDIVIKPFEIATKLTSFLGMPEYNVSVAGLLISRRVLSAFADKRPGDYNYHIEWSPQQKEFFIETCGSEMGAWGYEIDFDSPGVIAAEIPPPEERAVMLEMLGQQNARIAELERECLALRERLTQINQGRVMRVLNAFGRLRKRLFRGRQL